MKKFTCISQRILRFQFVIGGGGGGGGEGGSQKCHRCKPMLGHSNHVIFGIGLGREIRYVI